MFVYGLSQNDYVVLNIRAATYSVYYLYELLLKKMTNGSRLNLYLLNGVLNVKRFELSSSTLICQYPLESNFVKNLSSAISAMMDSAFRIG